MTKADFFPTFEQFFAIFQNKERGRLRRYTKTPALTLSSQTGSQWRDLTRNLAYFFFFTDNIETWPTVNRFVRYGKQVGVSSPRADESNLQGIYGAYFLGPKLTQIKMRKPGFARCRKG
jgi:hypothetical protein